MPINSEYHKSSQITYNNLKRSKLWQVPPNKDWDNIFHLLFYNYDKKTYGHFHDRSFHSLYGIIPNKKLKNKKW